MFEEMDSIHGLLLEGDQIAAMERAYSEFLRVKLEEGTTAAWVVREAGRVVSSGAVTFLQWPPSPRDAVTHAALVHSVYTLHERRRRGYAKQILQAAVDYCRKYGIHRVKLGASDAGRALYESLGFRPATSEMQLLLD
jgi:GNAT superfamily N-acetyltransferase